MFTAEMYNNNAGCKRQALNSWRIVGSVKDHICNPLEENFKGYASFYPKYYLHCHYWGWSALC